jgi:apolipoprotein N-acyltransferase
MSGLTPYLRWRAWPLAALVLALFAWATLMRRRG